MSYLKYGIMAILSFSQSIVCTLKLVIQKRSVTTQTKLMPKRIYNPITTMGFSKMFTFQLDNTKR